MVSSYENGDKNSPTTDGGRIKNVSQSTFPIPAGVPTAKRLKQWPRLSDTVTSMRYGNIFEMWSHQSDTVTYYEI